MKYIDIILIEIKSAFPNNWVVDGVKQESIIYQIGFIIGVIITSIISFLI